MYKNYGHEVEKEIWILTRSCAYAQKLLGIGLLNSLKAVDILHTNRHSIDIKAKELLIKEWGVLLFYKCNGTIILHEGVQI